MITSLSDFDFSRFYSDISICLPGGYLNPEAFVGKYKRYPWYPFEDLYIEADVIHNPAGKPGRSKQLFRQTLPCRGKACDIFSIDFPDKIDCIRISEWLNYDEGIIYFEDGGIILNSFSDFVVLAIGNDLSIDLFGEIPKIMFEQSTTIFKDSIRSIEVSEFMAKVEGTWNTRA